MPEDWRWGLGWAGQEVPCVHSAFPVYSVCVWVVPGVSQLKLCGNSREKKKWTCLDGAAFPPHGASFGCREG